MTTSIRFAVNPHGINKDWNFELLATSYQDRTGSLQDVVEHIKQGHALCAGLLGGKRRLKENVIGSQWILLDVDNSDVLKDEDGNPVKDEHGKTTKIFRHQLTIEEAIAHPFIQQHCALIYTSSSHTPEWHRFRLVFLLPEFISDVETYEAMVRLLMEQLPHDPACKDASRVFYGNTAAEISLFNPSAVLPNDWQAKAIVMAEDIKAKCKAQLLQATAKRDEFKQLAQEEGWDTDELIGQALRYIPSRRIGSGNYNECCQVLMALVDHYGPAQAEAVAERWSPSIRDTTWNIPHKIKSFRRTGITIGTLFYIAQKYGFKSPSGRLKRAWNEPDPQEYQNLERWLQEQEELEEAQHAESIFQNIRRILGRLASKQSRPKGFAIKEVETKTASFQVHEYEEGKRLNTWKGAIQRGYRYILDTSQPGSGKSHDAGKVDPASLGLGKSLYVTDQQRNPTTPTLAEWTGVEARHDGLVRDDRGNLRRATGNQSPSIPSNCSRTPVIAKLRTKGVDGADENIVCETCPMFDDCKRSEGEGFGFKYQRREAFKSDRIRIHPDSLPDPVDFPYAETLLILDEAGINFTTKKTIEVTLADINEAMEVLADKTPEQFILLQPVLSKLKELLAAKQPKYGYSHNDVLAALPAVPTNIDWEAIIGALQPNFTQLIAPSEINRKDFSKESEPQITGLKQRHQQDLNDLKQQERAALASLLSRGGVSIFKAERKRIKAEFKLKRQQLKVEFTTAQKRVKHEVKREFERLNRDLGQAIAQSTTQMAELIDKSVPKQWLSEFFGVLLGERGDLRVVSSMLKLSISSGRHRAIAAAAKAVVFMDATLSPEDLALQLQCDPDEIYVCRQKRKDFGNLKIIQVVDLGRMGMDRGEEQQRRGDAIVAHIKEQDPRAQEIDFKKFNKDGAWYRDSRGVNDFVTTVNLIATGTPCPNLGELAAQYAILTGCHDEDAPGFKAFVDRQIRANFEQCIERLRSHRRPDEQLCAYVLSDFDLNISTEKVKASDITQEAASKKERFLMAAQSAMSQLIELGEKLTQTAVAQLSGYSQQYISRYWKLLQMLLSLSNSKSGKNSDPIPVDDAQLFDEAIAVCKAPKEVLDLSEKVFHKYSQPRQQHKFWQGLRATTQTKVLEALFLTLPPGELHALKQILSSLQSQDKKATVVEIAGYRQGHTSRPQELLQSLLNCKSGSGDLSLAEQPELLNAFVDATDEAIASSQTIGEVLKTVQEVFYDWVKPSQWQLVWHLLKGSTQVKLLQALALTLPEDELSLLEQVMDEESNLSDRPKTTLLKRPTMSSS